MPDRRSDPYAVSPISGQTTTISGSSTALPDVEATRVLLRALPTNAANVEMGRGTGSFSLGSGFPLAAADPAIVLEGISNLNTLMLAVAADNDGIGWLVLFPLGANPLT